MKRQTVSLFVIVLTLLLAGCGGDLPFDFDFLPAVDGDRPPAATPIPVHTITPAASLVPTSTPSATLTFTPFPTPRSPYPVNIGTPMPDAGFPRISSGNTEQMERVFLHNTDLRRVSLVSPNGQRALVAMAQGLSLYSLQDGLLADWPEIEVVDAECDSCLTVDGNIDRFAVALRQAGGWEIRVYDVVENQPVLFKTFLGDEMFGVQSNPVQVALSPDGALLAYRFGNAPLKIHSFFQESDIFEYSGATRSLGFSQGGQYLFAHRDRDLIFWNIYDLQDGFRSLLTGDDPNSAMLFSRGGDYFAIASASRIRVYNISPLRLTREIVVPLAQGRQVTWQLVSEPDESFLRGAALYWDARAESYQVIRGVWSIASGEQVSVELTESQSNNVFDEFWGLRVSPPVSALAGFDPASIRAMRFSSADTLLINSLNSVCLFRLATSEASCQVSEDAPVHAVDGPLFREIREERNTLLINPMGETVFDVGPHSIEWVSRSGDFILIDNRRSTTDLYVKNRRLPAQSVPGVFQSVAENASSIVFLTRQSNGQMYVTMAEKPTGRTVFQKRETRLYNHLDMTFEGAIYTLREEYDGNYVTLRSIPAGGGDFQNLLQIDLLAPVSSLAVSPHNVLAIGMQDGAVIIVSLDSLTYETFQALQTGVTHLAFSPDSRYLAVTGRDGLTVFAVLP
jgi:WD40 repeat protein